MQSDMQYSQLMEKDSWFKKHWKKILIVSSVVVILTIVITLCCVLIPRKKENNPTPNNPTPGYNPSNPTPESNPTPVHTGALPTKFIFRRFRSIPTSFTDFNNCKTQPASPNHTYELEEFCGLPFQQSWDTNTKYIVRSRYLAASYATEKPETRRIFTALGNPNFCGVLYDAATTFVVEGSGADLMSDTMTNDRKQVNMVPEIINEQKIGMTQSNFEQWYKRSVRIYHERFDNNGAGSMSVRVNQQFCDIYEHDMVPICNKRKLSRNDLLTYVEEQSGRNHWNNEIVISPAPKDLLGFFFVAEHANKTEAKDASCRMRHLFMQEFPDARNVGVWECHLSGTRITTCNLVTC